MFLSERDAQGCVGLSLLLLLLLLLLLPLRAAQSLASSLSVRYTQC